MGPASASRRHARSEPLAQTSSSSPVRMSLSTAFRTASPATFVGRSTPRSLRREAVDRMTSWVSVSFDIGILHCVGARHCRHHHSPTSAMQPAGQDPEARRAPGTVTVPLCSPPNASPFLIMLLLVFGKLDNWMIRVWAAEYGDSQDVVHRSNPQRDCKSTYSGSGRGCYSNMEQSASRPAKSSISGGGDLPRSIHKTAACGLPA